MQVTLIQAETGAPVPTMLTMPSGSTPVSSLTLAALTGRRFLTPLSIRHSNSLFPALVARALGAPACAAENIAPAAKRHKHVTTPAVEVQPESNSGAPSMPSSSAGARTDGEDWTEYDVAAAAAGEHLAAIFKVAAPAELTAAEILAVARKAHEYTAEPVLCAFAAYLRPFFATAPQDEVRFASAACMCNRTRPAPTRAQARASFVCSNKLVLNILCIESSVCALSCAEMVAHHQHDVIVTLACRSMTC